MSDSGRIAILSNIHVKGVTSVGVGIAAAMFSNQGFGYSIGLIIGFYMFMAGVGDMLNLRKCRLSRRI